MNPNFRDLGVDYLCREVQEDRIAALQTFHILGYVKNENSFEAVKK